MIDFSAVEDEIRVDAGDVFSPVWTVYEDEAGTIPEDISGYEFEFDVLNARTGAVVVSALCTVLVGEVGQVQTTITDEQMQTLNPRDECRYAFRLLSLGEPTTLAKGVFRVMP